MRLVCNSAALNEGLQIASRAMSTRTANPILEGVLLEARMGQLRITASDERLTILTRVDCEVSESGRGVIPGKLFIDIVRRLQDNPTIEIGMNERFIFNIVSGASVMNVAGQDGDLYPALPALTDVSEFTLPQDSLRGMIEKTQFAIAVDDAREVLTGALLGNLRRRRHHGRPRRLPHGLQARKSLRRDGRDPRHYPRPRGRRSGQAALRRRGRLRLTLRFQRQRPLAAAPGKHRRLCDPHRRRVHQLPPPAAHLLPRCAPSRRWSRCASASTAPRCMAREGSMSTFMRFRLHEGMLEIESNSQLGDAHEEMPLEEAWTAARLTIAFNVRYMQDVVRTVDAEKIVLNFTDSLSPCVVTPADDLDYVHLVLPVRTGYSVVTGARPTPSPPSPPRRARAASPLCA